MAQGGVMPSLASSPIPLTRSHRAPIQNGDVSLAASQSLKHRFPGVGNGWSRFDAPSGTQMVDVAIEAVTEWMSSGDNGCGGGYFAAAEACDDQEHRARAVVGALLGVDPAGVVFGPNMTTLTFAFTRAVAETLRPGGRVVGTRLDHDANVTPWRRACERAGAEHVLAPFDPDTGTLAVDSVAKLIDERTAWVTIPGASNLIGTVPDHAAIIEAAHAVGARVFIDAVALVPHLRVDVAALGCDAIVTSPYKWYGPHAGALWVDPALLAALPVFKVRPAPDDGPRRLETGMPSYEALAGVEAAARFLLDEGLDAIAAAEREVFAPLLHGLQDIAGVRIWGPSTLEQRTPTVAFTVDGAAPADVSRALAERQIAVWDGNAYAVEVVDQLGLADRGGVVRAGLARYIEPDDVARLLRAVEELAVRRRSR
jgi:cysteine desulfurase family protein (TIGR01976 family)